MKLLRCLLILGIFCFSGSEALADKAERRRWKKACRKDIKICKHVLKGDGKLLNCMLTHRSSFQPKCKEALDNIAKEHE